MVLVPPGLILLHKVAPDALPIINTFKKRPRGLTRGLVIHATSHQVSLIVVVIITISHFLPGLLIVLDRFVVVTVRRISVTLGQLF